MKGGKCIEQAKDYKPLSLDRSVIYPTTSVDQESSGKSSKTTKNLLVYLKLLIYLGC